VSDPTGPRPDPPAEAPRSRSARRFVVTTLIAAALLWAPSGRVRWALATAERGVHGEAVVLRIEEREVTRADGSGTDRVVGHNEVAVCRVGELPGEVVWDRRAGLDPGARVPVAWLPERPDLISRAGPDAGPVGLYLGLDGLPMIDLLLAPLGLLVALAALANLFDALRPRARRGVGSPAP
jgi:hypothetical protein